METIYEKIIEIFGEYQPIVTVLENGESVVSVNYAYIAAILVFVVFGYCCFRLLGCVFKK